MSLTRLFLPAILLGITVSIAACCDRQPNEQFKSAANTAKLASPPASSTPPTPDSYPATLAEGIDFTKPGYPTFIASASGMSGYEPWGRWTDSDKAVFNFKQPLPKQFTLVIQANAFGPNLGEAIKINIGSVQQEFKITEKTQISLNFALQESADTITFLIPKPTSPKDLQSSLDPRKLGLGLIKLQIISQP